ncbi:MAG: DUF3343 domain-containing protein [Deltaproteobacteria bacterium]|nr:DUF3343 domain-containing protein [Deltaproteobacteria bacterium]
MVREGDLVAIFNSIHRVMKAEKILKERRLNILLIPAPRSLQSDCGLAIRYAEADREVVEGTLSEADLLPEERYRKTGEEYVRIAEREAPSAKVER